MKTTFTASAVLAASASALSVNSEFEQLFNDWAAKHGRDYSTMAEYGNRLQNWIKTHMEIQKINSAPGQTVVLGHNKFSDWTHQEYKAMLTFEPKDMTRNQEPTILDASKNADSIDWIEKGAVNEVQDQAACGSCWAFSAIASMEGQHFVQSGELLKLSEQQCVDCDSESYGCSGGWQDNCMWYVYDNGGISLEKDYPYTAGTDTCFADWDGPVSVSTVHSVKSYDEEQLLAALNQGPVSVTVDADSAYFRSYESGVITATDCGTKLDHAITAVGYGTDENGTDYYMVRNSWGKAWGDNGYLKIGRNGDGYGICGIQEISVWASTN